jgi:hypothetical protein
MAAEIEETMTCHGFPPEFWRCSRANDWPEGLLRETWPRARFSDVCLSDTSKEKSLFASHNCIAPAIRIYDQPTKTKED